MDDPVQFEAAPVLRPYGLFGLIVSLFGICMIAAAVLALGLGLVALEDWLLFDGSHLHTVINLVANLAHGMRMEDALIVGLTLGSAVYVAGIIGIWAMARLRAGKAWALLLGWTPFKTDRVYWGLLLASMVYGPLASLLMQYLNPDLKLSLTLPEHPLAIAAGVCLVVVLAPLAEELLFRGWIYTALRWRFGFSVALWATAILFGIAHWESTHLYALAILPMGLVLGYVRERTGSTRATTLFHMIYNFSGLVLTFLGKA